MGSALSGQGGACHGVEITGGRPMLGSWWATVALAGKVYGIPCNAEAMLVYDTKSQTATCIETQRVAKGEGKWRAAAVLGNRVYAIPDSAERLLVLDVPTGRVFGFDTQHIAKGPLKWQDALAFGGKLYGIPHHADKILVYDPTADKLSGVAVSNVSTGPSKWLVGIAHSGKLYCIPCNAASILTYNPITGKVSGIDVSNIAKGPMKWLAALAYDGKLYALPCHAECILVYDPSKGQVSGVSTTSVATGPGKWTSAVALGGRIYGIPDHANSLLIYDVTSGVVSGIDVSGFASGPCKWQTGICFEGLVYAVPYNADSFLVYDPSSGDVSSSETAHVATGQGKWSGALVLNGVLFCMPFNAPRMLVHEAATDTRTFNRTEDLPSYLSDELIEDFVAAWLSEWIYWVRNISSPCPVPNLTVGGDAVTFLVHKVCEDPLHCGPARVATVTAAIPGRGSAVYLVFKGSSFLADFVVNASVSPDYVPFHQAFADSTTFVHHGAHHAMAQLKVHQWMDLMDQFRDAIRQGASHLIVCGHSLGGQYALAFMLQVFLEERKHLQQMKETKDTDDYGDVELLNKIRCVSFGSPMCYGSAEGHEVRKDLAEFMHGRSVVYINRGDPAPRLWSELNLNDFMRYSVDWLHGHISGICRRLVDIAAGTGGLAKRAEDLLGRPDIEVHLLRPAARYVHLSRMRILGTEFRPWTPLSRDDMSIEDHDLLDAYIPALSNAFHASSGSLFDDTGKQLISA